MDEQQDPEVAVVTQAGPPALPEPVQSARREALSLLALVAAGAIVSLALVTLLLGDDDVFAIPQGSSQLGVYTLVLALSFGVSGLLVATERPANPIGWILLLSGLLWSTSEVLGAYATRALAEPGSDHQFGGAALWAAAWMWVPAVTLPLVVLPQVYPDGRVVGPRWRWVLGLAGLGTCAVTLGLAASSYAPDSPAGDALGPITWPASVPTVGLALLVLGAAGMAAGLLAGVVGLVVRFRRGTPQVQSQVLWLAVPALIGGVTLFTRLSFLTVILWYPLIPVTVTIGVLGYELLGIQVTMRRLLVYLPMTLLIALLVGGITTVIAQRSAGTASGAVIAACLIALVVLPLRDILVRLADRLLYGSAREPLAVIGQLGSADPADPLALLAALAQSIRSPGVALRDSDGQILAQHGVMSESAVAFPLPGPGGTQSGPGGVADIVVSPRRAEHTLDPSDVRLLAAVTPHLAAAIRARALAEELEAERARVVAATDSERARLRRDLHDGLGPALSGIALGAEAAMNLVTTNPVAATALLRRLQEGATLATEEVRRAIDDLQPTALDTAPLGDAVRQAADRVAPDVAVVVLGAVDLAPPEVAEAIYRIAAEALTNVARHSGASHCQVHLEAGNGVLALRVRDDGCGMSGAGAWASDAGDIGTNGSGIGLDSMRRRAAALGGNLTVNPLEPMGTEVVAMLPLGTAPA